MFSWSCSNENSGVCMPSITSPSSRYRSSQARTYGSVRIQLMHVYVQKSTTTTRPWRSDIVEGWRVQPAGRPTE